MSKPQTIIKTHKSWVIHTRSNEGHGVIGRLWWFEEQMVR